MKARIFSMHLFVSLIVVITLLITNRSFSQIENPFGTVSVRTSVGFAYLPLPAWTKFWETFGPFYHRNNPNVYYALSVHCSLSPEHSINIGSELLRTSASLTDDFGAVEWKFQGIPVTIGYEYKLFKFNQSFSIVTGLGASYFFSRLTGQEHSIVYTDVEPKERIGKGYGIHVTAALMSNLNESLSMVTQVRYRYSDGMAFTDKSNAVKIEFTGLDLSIGLAWTFLLNDN